MATTTPVCIDISHHNPTPDWDKIKMEGVLGVIHKATEGGSYVDPKLFDRARQAMDAGLYWSTYHFLRPGSMYAQMDHYISTIDPVKGERVCLDHEDASVSLGQLETAVKHIFEMRPDLKVAIYSGHLIKAQLAKKGSDYLGANTSLWLAQYTKDPVPTWPINTWTRWSLWQYTDKAIIPGIIKPVDGDNFNGSREQFIKWISPASSTIPIPIPPTQPTEEKTLTITLDGISDDYTTFKLIVNGKEV